MSATKVVRGATGDATQGGSDLIRSSVLMGYSNLVQQLGGEPAALLRSARIPEQALADEESCISFRSVIRLLDASAVSLECLDFGLRLAQCQDLRILGPIRVIGVNSASVGDALRAMISHLAFYCPAVICKLDTRSDSARPRLTYDVAVRGEPHKRQLFELALGLLTRHMHALTNGNFTPVSVQFRHSSHLPPEAYRRYLGVRPQFGAAVNALVVRPSDLRRPLANCDASLRKVFEAYVRGKMLSEPVGLGQQVRQLVRANLRSGCISLREIAAELFVHERTLQRRLERQGSSFEDIVDSVRRDRMEELLSESPLTMSQVSYELGYTKQSSFNRASRRWFGQAPRALKVLLENDRGSGRCCG